MIHPKVEHAFQEIDAALFSGDTFDDPESRSRLSYWLKRWEAAIDEKDRDMQVRTNYLLDRLSKILPPE